MKERVRVAGDRALGDIQQLQCRRCQPSRQSSQGRSPCRSRCRLYMTGRGLECRTCNARDQGDHKTQAWSAHSRLAVGGLDSGHIQRSRCHRCQPSRWCCEDRSSYRSRFHSCMTGFEWERRTCSARGQGNHKNQNAPC